MTKTVTAAPGGAATSSTAGGSPSASDDQSLPKAAGCDGSNAQVRPSEIDISCDGTYVIKNLSWSSWTSSSATGTGDVIKVTCTPSCADGPATTKRLPIKLSDPQSSPAGQEFSKIDTDPGGPNADSGSLTVGQ